MLLRRVASLLLIALCALAAPLPASAFVEDISRFNRITIGDEEPEGTCTPFKDLHVMMPESKFLLCKADGTGYARDGIMTGAVFPLTCAPGEDSFISSVTKCLYVCNTAGNNWDPQPGCLPGQPGTGASGAEILWTRHGVTTTFNDMTLAQHLVVRVMPAGGAKTITLPDPADILTGGLFKVVVGDNSAGTVRLAPSAGATINGRSSPTETITGKGSYFLAERLNDTEWMADSMAPTVVGDVFKGASNTWTTGIQSFAAATGLTLRTGGGCVPTSDGEHCYDTTKKAHMLGGGGVTGAVSRIRSLTLPNETKTNSTTSTQAYASVYTIPASFFQSGKKLCVNLTYKYVTDSAASSLVFSLYFGATPVYNHASAFTPPNSATRSFSPTWCATGTAAPGASVGVNVAPRGTAEDWSTTNSTTQPVLLATNGTLTVVPVIQYGTNTSGESITLVEADIEERN